MAINKDNIDFLFNVMKFYDEQYNQVADNCFHEINRALNEIAEDYLKPQNVRVLPVGVYAIKNNYQMLEPMEFYCIMSADRSILDKEKLQKEISKKRKKSVKDIYENITSVSNARLTAIDVAGVIMREMQKYIESTDKLYYKNNVIFIKFHIDDEVDLSINIYVVYDFENNDLLEMSKLGYKIKENSRQVLLNIQKKNAETNGNYLLLCKLIKMLELELVLSNRSNIYLSKKTLFIENILYNVPSKFYIGEDFCEMFKNIINYLKQCDVDKIVIPDGNDNSMFSNYGYYANSYFKSFINKIVFIYKNADEMIKEALNESQANQENNVAGEQEESTNTLDEPSKNETTEEKPEQNIKKTKEIKKINKKG